MKSQSRTKVGSSRQGNPGFRTPSVFKYKKSLAVNNSKVINRQKFK